LLRLVSGFVALDADVAAAAPHDMALIPCRHAQQGIHRHAEGFLDPERHLRRQTRLFVQKVGQRGPAHPQEPGRTGDRKAEFLQDFGADEAAGMRRRHADLHSFPVHR